MVDIQSKEVIDKISDELKIQPALEIPRQISKEIGLVYTVNPMPDGIVKSSSTANTGTRIIFTTPTDRDFFMTSSFLGYTCDATCDSITYSLNILPKGRALANVVILSKQTLTTTTENTNFVFPNPILLERGSNINMIQTFSAGTSVINGSISGFEKDPQ